MATCTGFIEPLSLQCWLVNVFAGSPEIFVFIAMIAISALAARFRMPNFVILIMLALFALLFSSLVGGLYLITIVLIGLFVGAAIKRVITR